MVLVLLFYRTTVTSSGFVILISPACFQIVFVLNTPPLLMYICMSDSFVFTCLFGQDKTILTVDNFERVTFGLVDSPDFLEIKSI